MVNPLPTLVIDALLNNDIQRTGKILANLSGSPSGWHSEYIQCLQSCVLSGDWSPMTTHFVNKDFLNSEGYLFLIGPYAVRRSSEKRIRMSGVYGKVIPFPGIDFGKLHTEAEKLCGALHEESLPIIPISVMRAFGLTATPQGEAFIVPNGWQWPESGDGPALNDLIRQRERFVSYGRRCIEQIFDEDSKDFLLHFFDDENEALLIQNREYQYHEVGHATGIGLKTKLAQRLLKSPLDKAIEEWRSDGIEFALLKKTLPDHEATKTILSNIVLRLGLDAQRPGGLMFDNDVLASLLTFDALLASGNLIVKNKKLSLVKIDTRSTIDMVSVHSIRALNLTREEISLPTLGIFPTLYNSLSIPESSKKDFEEYVRKPCMSLPRLS